jgi:Patatin-like phospholipase
LNHERVLWYVIFAAILWGSTMGYQSSRFDLGNATTPSDCSFISGNPILDLELSSSAVCFEEIINQGDSSTNVKIARTNTRLDFLFIALYCTMFALFAIVYKNRWSSLLGACIALTGVLDVLENSRILNGLGRLNSLAPDWMTPRPFSFWKWIAFAIVLFWTASLVKVGHRFLSATLFLAAIFTLAGVHFALSMKAAGACLSLALIVASVQYFPFEIKLSWLQYAYLMRFQIVFGLLLAVGLPAGYFFVPSIFLGLFDTRGLRSFTLVVWASLQLAWAIMVTSRLVLAYGAERFPDVIPTNVQAMKSRTVIFFGLLAVPCILMATLASLDVPGWQILLGIVSGTAIAALVLFLTAMLHFAIEFPSRTTAEIVFPSFGILKASTRKPTAPEPFVIQSTNQGHRSMIEKTLDGMGKLVPPELQQGIWDSAGILRSGHQLALTAVAILLAVYAILGFAFYPAHIAPEHQPAALFYLLFLFTLLTWVLSGASFFLDRLRLPVFSTLIACSFLTGVVGTDHEFSITTLGEPDNKILTPVQVVKDWAGGLRKNGDTITIVSTAGGGIRASAWTAEVLTRLQEQCGAKFSSSLLLISSVSGGSVGSMAFLTPYQSLTGDLPHDSLDPIRRRSSRSSLSGVGWGFLYPDFVRTVPLVGAFVPQTFDRGWALENSWMSGAKIFPNLGQWRKDVDMGTRPAAIFNATAAESGERFVIASTDIDPTGTVVFSTRFPNWDIPIATAARLSATFPYVSPMAKASGGPADNRFHAGDGGYYDNSGVLSAVAWLREAKPEVLKAKYRVLFILIDSEPGSEPEGKTWSWQRQIIAPVETLENVRTSSQEFRDKVEFETSVESLTEEGLKVSAAKFLFRVPPHAADGMKIGAGRALFSRYLGVDVDAAPLSWHLNQAQMQSIERAWDDPSVNSARKVVYSEMGCPLSP